MRTQSILNVHRTAVCHLIEASPTQTATRFPIATMDGPPGEPPCLHAIALKAYVPPTSFAWIYLGLGETDRAFDWFDRAVDARDQMLMPIKSYPFFDAIRGDPRYLALLRKMNLEP